MSWVARTHMVYRASPSLRPGDISLDTSVRMMFELERPLTRHDSKAVLVISSKYESAGPNTV